MKQFLMRIVRGDATKQQAQDTGMAVVLVLLLLALTRQRPGYVLTALVIQVVNMTAPQVFRPVAVVWLGFAHLLGSIVSRILLALIFFVGVTPVGVVRRMFGWDSLRLRSFKAARTSVMHERNHTFTGQDLENPF